MSNTVLIDMFAKCRLESLFGNGTYYGCLSISNIVLALGMAGLLLVILSIIILKFSKKEENKE